jgi:hypothetical protein
MKVEIREKETVEDATPLTLKMEEGALSQGMEVASRCWKKQGNDFSPRDLRRNSDLQNCKIINLCCAKP